MSAVLKSLEALKSRKEQLSRELGSLESQKARYEQEIRESAETLAKYNVDLKNVDTLVSEYEKKANDLYEVFIRLDTGFNTVEQAQASYKEITGETL